MGITRRVIVEAIFAHRPIEGARESRAYGFGGSRPLPRTVLEMGELVAAFAEIKRNFPDFRHRTGGLDLRWLSISGGRREPGRIEAPVSLNFTDCEFVGEGPEEPFRFAGLSINALSFENCRFHSSPSFDNTTVLENLEIVDCKVDRGLRFARVRVGGDLRLRRIGDIGLRCESVPVDPNAVAPEISDDDRAEVERLNERHLKVDIGTWMPREGDFVRFLDCRIGGVLWLSEMPKGGRVDIRHSTVRDEVGVHRSELGSLTLSNCRLDDDLKLMATSVAGLALVSHCAIEGDIDWRRPLAEEDREGDGLTFPTETGSDGVLRRVGRIVLEDLHSGGNVTLADIEVPSAEAVVDIPSEREGIRIERCRFGGNALFSGLVVGDVVAIRDGRFEGVARFENAALGSGLKGARPRPCLEIANVVLRDGLSLARSRAAGGTIEKSTYATGLRISESTLGKLDFHELDVPSDQSAGASLEVLRTTIGSTLTFGSGMRLDGIPIVFQNVDVTGSVEFAGAQLQTIRWIDSRIGAAVAFEWGEIEGLSLIGSTCDELRFPCTPPAGGASDAKCRIGLLKLEDFHAVRLAGDLSLWATSRRGDDDARSNERGIADVEVKGFTYARLDDEALGALRKESEAGDKADAGWLMRLRRGTEGRESETGAKTRFDARPWAVLAKAMREMGHDDLADAIAHDQRRRRREAASLPSQAFDTLLDLTSVYGYEPQRTLVVCLLALTLFGLKSASLGMYDEVVVRRLDNSVVEHCTVPAAMTRRMPSDFELQVFNAAPAAKGDETKPAAPSEAKAPAPGDAKTAPPIEAKPASAGAAKATPPVEAKPASVGETKPAATAPNAATETKAAPAAEAKPPAPDPIDFATATYPALSQALYHLDTFFPLLDLDMHALWVANTGAKWDAAHNRWILPVRTFSPACQKLAASKDYRVEALSVIGTKSEVVWATPETSRADAGDRYVGVQLFWLFTIERIVGALLTALLIVGMTGILRKADE